ARHLPTVAPAPTDAEKAIDGKVRTS
ncbi:hypothetical protein, partial [Pseudomonas chlororaphis]